MMRANNISRETATNDLRKLVELKIIAPLDSKGAGAYYTLK